MSVGTLWYQCTKAGSATNTQFLQEDCRRRIWAKTSNSCQQRRVKEEESRLISYYWPHFTSLAAPPLIKTPSDIMFISSAHTNTLNSKYKTSHLSLSHKGRKCVRCSSQSGCRRLRKVKLLGIKNPRITTCSQKWNAGNFRRHSPVSFCQSWCSRSAKTKWGGALLRWKDEGSSSFRFLCRRRATFNFLVH